MSNFKCSKCNHKLDEVENRSYYWYDIAGVCIMFMAYDMPFFFAVGCLYWIHRIWNYKFSKNIEAKCPHCGNILSIPPELQKAFDGLKKSGFLE